MMPEQLVKVVFDSGPQLYTYKWTFTTAVEQAQGTRPLTPLTVGERVVTPPNWRNHEEGLATVAELGSDWPGGPVAQLVRRAIDGE
jgi:hypothetical protein